MRITVAGAGYVGMANALVLAQHHEVSVLDISAEWVAMIGQGKSPVRDECMERWLSEGCVGPSAFSDAEGVKLFANTLLALSGATSLLSTQS